MYRASYLHTILNVQKEVIALHKSIESARSDVGEARELIVKMNRIEGFTRSINRLMDVSSSP
jgi:hypothetical protein